MGTGIKTRIVKIGNSQGVRIPKPLLEQSGINTDVEIEVYDDRLVLRPASQPRTGWGEAFAAMAAAADDDLLDAHSTTEWDRSEWEW
jgi:antitoxin MazE